jgi:hypothetical protein
MQFIEHIGRVGEIGEGATSKNGCSGGILEVIAEVS